MQTYVEGNVAECVYPRVECRTCQRTLPLRSTKPGEHAALWVCTLCKAPTVAFGIDEELIRYSQEVKFDDSYFDLSGAPSISREQIHEAARIAHRFVTPEQLQMRRSKRIVQSLQVPLVVLGPGFTPLGRAFRTLVANLSKEGIGLVHDEWIDAQYVAAQLSPPNARPIQVIIQIRRQEPLEGSKYVEIGGEFYLRLGSVTLT